MSFMDSHGGSLFSRTGLREGPRGNLQGPSAQAPPTPRPGAPWAWTISSRRMTGRGGMRRRPACLSPLPGNRERSPAHNAQTLTAKARRAGGRAAGPLPRAQGQVPPQESRAH